MALKLEDKKTIVAEVAKQASTALSAAVADYSGLSANQMNTLRQEARELDVYIRVIQNNLARLAFSNTEFKCMSDILQGPLVLAFSRSEPAAVAKLFKNFIKENSSLQIKHLAIDGRLFGAEKLEEMSSLLSRSEAIALLCGTLLAPVATFTRVFNEIPARTVRVVFALAKKK